MNMEDVIFVQYTELGQAMKVGTNKIPKGRMVWKFPIRPEIGVYYEADIRENPPELEIVEYRREGQTNIFSYNPYKIITLEYKRDKRGGHGYDAVFSNGSRYSIMNFASLMESAPEEVKQSGVYMGWEAIKIPLNGNVNWDYILRADSEGKLIQKIISHEK